MIENAQFMGRLSAWIVAALGLLALVLAGVWLAQPDDAVSEDSGRPAFVVPVVLAELQRGELAPRALLSGTVRAARRARLGFDTSGIIRALDVNEADVVHAGIRLAAVQGGDEEFELAAAEAGLALTQRERELLLAGEREEEKRRLLAALDAARAEATLTGLEAGRGDQLLSDGLIPQSEHDRRSALHSAVDKRRVAAEEEYGRAVAGARVEDLAIAAARVAEAAARVSTAKHELGKTELFAPWPGSIIQRFVSVGDYVSAGDPVFELIDLENLEVHIEVPARLASRVGADSSVAIEIARRSDFRIERRLDATIPAADPTSRGFRAIVRLDSSDDPLRILKPGMSVNVELMLERVRDALILPSDCVLANEHGTFIVRALAATSSETADAHAGAPGLIADFVPVKVLAEVEGRSAIRSLGAPLYSGDSVVLVGGDNAYPGATLVPREAPGKDRTNVLSAASEHGTPSE